MRISVKHDVEELTTNMVVIERGLSPLRVFVVLMSIQVIFFLYHVALSNPGYVNLAAVVPWAVNVTGKLGECMEVAAWWLVYGRSPSFVVRSVMIPSVVHPTMLSADAKSSEGVIVDDIVGGPVLLPKVSSTETVHVFVAADVAAQLGNDPEQSGSEPALKAPPKKEPGCAFELYTIGCT